MHNNSFEFMLAFGKHRTSLRDAAQFSRYALRQSMAHFKYLILFVFASLLIGCKTTPVAPVANQSITTPKAPPGMSWQESSIGVGTFLRPDGWYLKEETKGDTSALFISKENIDLSGRFLVGLSVNKISNFSIKQTASPSQYAKSFAVKLATSGEVLKQSVVKGDFPDMNIVRVKSIRNNESVIVHYITIGDDKKSIVYIISFESPERDWEQQFKYGSPMLNYFFL